MNTINDSITNNRKVNYNYNIKYPFIKIKARANKDKRYFIKKLNNSDKIINSQIDTLLYSGFPGTEEDFKKIYHKREIKGRLNKSRAKSKFNKTLMVIPNYMYKSHKYKKSKEINNSAKYNSKALGLLSLLNNYKLKNKEKKENGSWDNEKTLEINKNKSENYKRTKNDSSSNKTHTINEINSSSEKENKIKRIRKMSSLLTNKTKEILDIENNNFEKKPNKILIRNIKLEKVHNIFKPKKTLYQKIQSISCKNHDKRFIKGINTIFNKYLILKQDDTIELRKILDPLKTIFKSSLREVKKVQGNDHENIWMKRTTANIISFGKTFQSISDDIFFKIHRSIFRKYPEIQKEAEILVPANNIKDDSIIKKLQRNQKRIRLICNDNDALLRGVKKMYQEYHIVKSNSNPLIKGKIK